MSNQFLFVQAQKFTLSGSGVTSNATSIILKSFKLPDASTTITMANFGGVIGFGTLEPGTPREEQISFTGVTQNADGTATLTGVTRGVRFVSPYDSVAANMIAHSGGSIFVISNTSGFYSRMVSEDNDETITGLYTFTQFPVKSGTTTPTAADQFATKAYVDSVVGGTAVYDQNIITSVAGETLAAGDSVYFKVSDGRWWLTDADTAATVDGVITGFAQAAAVAGAATNIAIGGLDKNQSGLTQGTTYYASNTAGDISSTPGTVSRVVGQAASTTTIIINPFFTQIPTAREKALLAQILAGTDFYAASATGTDAYAITITPAITAYVAGMKFRFKADVANTGAATLNVSGVGAVTIKKMNDQDLSTGDIEAGQIVEVVHDGTNFQMTSQLAQTPSVLNYQSFTASGTWTKPSNLTGDEIAHIQLWGAGGGGGGIDGNAGTDAGGAGGGGGAYTELFVKVSALGATETVTLGVGGTGGTAGDNDGTAGGNSTFGSLLTAFGGGFGEGTNAPGSTSAGGGGGGGIIAAGSNGSGNGTGGAGGGYGGGAAATVPSTKDGGAGGGGTNVAGAAAYFGGGGGGGGRNTSATAYAGGASKYGGGGGGGGLAGAGGVSTFGGSGGAAGSNANGTAGSAPGGGGGGGGSTGATNYAGGDGARGECRVWIIK